MTYYWWSLKATEKLKWCPCSVSVYSYYYGGRVFIYLENEPHVARGCIAREADSCALSNGRVSMPLSAIPVRSES